MDAAEQIEFFKNQFAILDIINLYAEYVDDKNWDGWRELFTAEVSIDLTFKKFEGERETVVNQIADGLKDLKTTNHLITNSRIVITGDKAASHSKLLTTHTTKDDERLTSGGTYYHEFVLTDAGWKIALAANKILWSDGDTAGAAAAGAARQS